MEDETKTSEFNEAQLQILRLHNIWLASRNYRESGKMVEWKWALVSVEVELNNDAIRLDKQKKTAWVNNIEEVNKEIDAIDIAKTEMDFRLLFKSLLKKEKLLKQLQEAAGKGTKLKFEEDKF
jgi:hypothetical protein